MDKIKQTNRLINCRYDVTYSMVSEVIQNSSGQYDLFSNSFALGYLQGMKAAKAEMKKGGVVSG